MRFQCFWSPNTAQLPPQSLCLPGPMPSTQGGTFSSEGGSVAAVAREGPSGVWSQQPRKWCWWERGRGSCLGVHPRSPVLLGPWPARSVHLFGGLPLPLMLEASFTEDSGSPDSCVWGVPPLSLFARAQPHPDYHTSKAAFMKFACITITRMAC